MRESQPNIWTFRASAVQWLRYKRQCTIVSIERGIGPCIPDVLGCEKSRFLTEIEIKRTMADFRANKEKESMRRRELLFQSYPVPKFFYFLVPADLSEFVRDELPDGAGLLSFGKASTFSGLPELLVLRKASASPRSRRLSVKEMVTFAKAQSGTPFSVLKQLHKNPELCREERDAE